MIWLILVALVAIAIYFLIRNMYSYWDRQGVKNVKPKNLMNLLGIQTEKSLHETLRENYDNFDDRYFGIYNMSPILIIKDLELIKKITVKEFISFHDHRKFAPSGLDPLWHNNLFSADGEQWRQLRALLSPSFTGSKMRNMFNLMQDCAQQFTDFFLDQNKEIIDVEFKDIFTRFTNDVIATSAFGIRCNSLKEPKNTFYEMGKESFNITGLRFFTFIFSTVCPPFILKALGVRLFPKKVAEYFKSIIEETIDTREKNNIIRPDMIHLLMEARKGTQTVEEDFKENKEFASVNEYDLGKSASSKKLELTVDDIVAQAFIFFFAGFETSSTAITFVAYELAINPDIQERLLQEVDETNKTCNGKITYEALLKMTYLDMIVSESLRMWPGNPFLDRKVTKDFLIEPERPNEKPFLVKKGSIIWIPTVGLHYDAKYFPNPDKFDPERFSEENKHKINPATYTPFGAGPRNCIGSRMALLEIKLLLFNILRNFEVVPTSKSQIPVKLAKISLVPKAENGFHFALKKRSH